LTVCGIGVVDIGFAASARWHDRFPVIPFVGEEKLDPGHFRNCDRALPFERNYKHNSSNCHEERSRKKTAAGQHGNSKR
jgi:hypothetical protein